MAADKEQILFELKIEENRASKKLKAVKEAVKTLDRRTVKYKNTVKEQIALESKLISIRKQRVIVNKQMEGSVKKLTKAQEKGLSAAGASTSATLELGRVISDAPYGIRGMANNIQQLGSNLFFMSKKVDDVTGKTLGFRGAVGNLLGGLIGPAGLLIAFQGLIALWDYLGDGAKKAESDTRDFLAGISDLLEVQTNVNDKIEEYLVLQKLKTELDNDKKKSNEELRKVDAELLEIEKNKVNTLKLITLNEKAYADSKDKSTTKAKGYLKNETANAKKLEELTTKENELNTKRSAITSQYLEKLKKYRKEKDNLTKAEADTLKGLKELKKEKEKERELLSKTSEDYKRLTIAIDEYQKKIEEIEGRKNKGSGNAKKISPFKTPEELDIDIKNADNAIIQYEKRIEDARLKEEMNEKLSTTNTEYEKRLIREKYQEDRLRNQIDAERKVLKLKMNTEKAVVNQKVDNHIADLKRATELYIHKVKLDKNLSSKQKEQMASVANSQLQIATNQAQKEGIESVKEITEKYNPLFTLFERLGFARMDALFSGFGDETKSKKSDGGKDYKLEDALGSYMELQQGLTNFMSGEFDRQITLEQNKTNAINNELRERLNGENLSKSERKRIQLEIARNDEALRKKQEKIEKKRFKMQKAANISAALIQTYLAATTALKNFGGVPTGIPAMSATIAAGLLNVATIARQKFQSSAGATPTAGALGGGGSGGNDRSFNFNLAGASQENQLAQTLQGRFNQPLQAYVVSRDITNQQQLDEEITSSASFG
jgi:hypothetical protein